MGKRAAAFGGGMGEGTNLEIDALGPRGHSYGGLSRAAALLQPLGGGFFGGGKGGAASRGWRRPQRHCGKATPPLARI